MTQAYDSSEGFVFLKLKYNATSYTIFSKPPMIKGADKMERDCNIEPAIEGDTD